MLSAQVHDNGLSMLTHVAGSQIFSGEPSSLTASPASLEQKKKPAYKRKRSTDAPSDTESSSSHPTTRTRDGPKKKKANRACFHCQKAHLTCDDCECPSLGPQYSRHLCLLRPPYMQASRTASNLNPNLTREGKEGEGLLASCTAAELSSLSVSTLLLA